MRTFIEKDLYLGSRLELINLIVKNTNGNIKKAYYAINSDCMLKYWNDLKYREIINNSDNISYVDGMGVIYAQKVLKLPVAKERIATTDLFPELVNHLSVHKSDLRIFLLGGEKCTAEKVKKNFFKKYPDVNIVGTHHGYFDKINDSKRIINLINSLNVNILLVGFGNPIQEKWVEKHFTLLQANTIITCGGLFDYYANNVKRAPLIFQKTGFEWLFRLIQEPRRLYKRYVYGNFNYVVMVLSMKLRS